MTFSKFLFEIFWLFLSKSWIFFLLSISALILCCITDYTLYLEKIFFLKKSWISLSLVIHIITASIRSILVRQSRRSVASDYGPSCPSCPQPVWCMYLSPTLVLWFLSGVRVCLRLSQFSQFSVQPKKSSFILRLEGIHSHLQLLLTLFQFFYLLTELLLGTCRLRCM